MAAFSATEAAFAGFGIMAKRPMAVLAWVGLYLVVGVVSVALIIQFAGPQFMALQDYSAQQAEGQPPDPNAALKILGSMGALFAIALPVALLFYGVIYASAYRAVLRPEEAAPFNLKLGGAELTQALLMVIMVLLFFAAYLAIVLVAGLVGGIAMAAAPASARIWIGVAIGAFCLAAILVVVIRLSLAGPASFAEGGLRVFSSWKLTRGAFWSLLGAYVLSFAIMIVVLAVAYGALFVGLMGAQGFSMEKLTKFFEADFTSFGAYFTPGRIVYLTVSSLLSAFMFAMMLGPAAYAYREITGGNAVKEF